MTPFALREEMGFRVENMLSRGIIRESSPWLAPVILVPKRALDEKTKYRFVGFRALKNRNHLYLNSPK
jgi:hypothetical protein